MINHRVTARVVACWKGRFGGRTTVCSALAAGLVLAIAAGTGVTNAAAARSGTEARSAKQVLAKASTDTDPASVAILPGTKKAILVGSVYTSTGGSDLAELWTGSAWTSMKITNPPTEAGLQSVWAASSKDAWAVGSDNSGPQVLHWTGGSWALVSIPGLPSGSSFLSVSGSSSSNVWVVGSAFSGSASSPIEAHYNGSSWKVLEQGGSNIYLFGVSVASSSTAWAIGGSDTSSAPVVLKYAGSSWAPTSTGVPTDVSLSSVSASGSKAWAVGSSYKVSKTSAVAMSWNGSKWVASKVAPPAGTAPRLTGVIIGAKTTWAIGDFQPSTSSYSAFVDKYAGGKWKLVKLPTLPSETFFSGMGGVTGNLWVVGYHWTGKVCQSSTDPVAYHDTTSWKQKNPATSSTSSSDVPTC